MNHRKFLIGALHVVMTWMLLFSTAQAQTSANISTRFLARGEQAVLHISSVNAEPDRPPRIPPVPGVLIQESGLGVETRMLPGRQLAYSFRYIVSSYAMGNHVIPPIELSIGGVTSQSQPVEIKVFDPDELQWLEVAAGGRILRYASSFQSLKSNPFVGETVPTEIKIYVPRDIGRVEDWGVPEFERDGVASWRFAPSDSGGQVNLLGRPYIALGYPSTLSPTRTGPVSIGPATVRLTTRQVSFEAFQRHVFEEMFLKIPKLDLESRPLPPDAPEGFENAVGSFTLNASTAEAKVKEGDPLSVDLIVRGRGNLDNLNPPKLIDASGWKVYDATPNQRGDERREMAGIVIFRQFMRPLEMKSFIPPFRLVYFDPEDESYKTVTTEPIKLDMQPAARSATEVLAPPPTLAVPVERMTDILAVIPTSQLTMPARWTFPGWLGHVLAAMAALGLIARALWMRFSHLLHKDPVRDERARELRELTRTRTDDDTSFLKAAGAFIERWLADRQDPELKGILAERDAVCFRAEKPKQVLDRRRRDEITRILRKAAMTLIWIAACSFFITPAKGSENPATALEAYESARYEEAIQSWLSAGKYEDLTADTLYNIGNACYRLGSSGYAALFYRRALARDATHDESRQNLRFIERKHGAITVDRPDYQHAIAKLPLSTWKGAVWTGLWMVVLAVLVFPASHRGARVRVVAVCALVLGPLIASAGALGWRYFPNDSAFAPVERQAVIVEEKVVLRADAARTAPEVIDAPPVSLCEVIRESGRWAYIAFASQTRGWVPVESIEKILPDTPPSAPKIRKPKADASSA